MIKITNLIRLLAAALLALSLTGNARAQLTFSTLAGYAGKDTQDGPRSLARFVSPAAIAFDAAGNAYIADNGNHTIRKISTSGLVSTIAGSPGLPGSADGTNATARFNQPSGITVDSSGTIYVADSGNHTIRKITTNGVVTTLAGQAGVAGTLDQLGTNASFNFPMAIVINSTGHLLVADYGNHSIRKITPGGSVSTFAGVSASSGTNDGVGASARFFNPSGLAIDSSDTLYVGDTGNDTIRKITPSGTVSTIAGTAGTPGSDDDIGLNAGFSQPEGIAVDAAGNLYVADYMNQTIRMIAPDSTVSTLAGSPGVFGYADGISSSARFMWPEAVALAPDGTIYVTDTGNGTIRQITVTAGVASVSTSAGSSSAGAVDANGNLARFFAPGGVAVNASGDAYIADTENNVIRKVTASGLVSTFAGSVGVPGSTNGIGTNALFYGPQGVALDAAGNVYVTDTGNSLIRKITPGGTVTTLAGLAGVNGSCDGTNSSALFNNPQALCVDSSGNVFVADTWNHVIREVTPAGVVTTIAGYSEVSGNMDSSNSVARFNNPAGIAIDANGFLYVSDTYNYAIRMLTNSGGNWYVSTISGLPGVFGATNGSGVSPALFNLPQHIAIDAGTNIYIVESANSDIRKLSPSGASWTASTAAGLPGTAGFTNGTGNAARFMAPIGIGIGTNGAVVVADAANNTIRLSTTVAGLAIINQPLSQTVNPGTNVTFTVTATGTGTLTYQWRFNGSNISGANASTLTRLSVQATNSGLYSVIVSNSSSSITSADAALVVNAAPVITQQPQSQVVAVGQAANFTVIASGTAPLSYQWRYAGAPLPGQTGTSLTVPAVSVTNTAAYSVVVSNLVSSTISADAFITVVTLSAQGDNSFGQSATSLAATNAVAIAAGAWHTMALRVDGHVVAWGDDFNGQCDVPTNLTDAVAIAAGGYHSAAIRSNGRVVAWGANDYGQTNVPAGLTNIVAISCGTWHTLALRADGTVVGWGDNSDGQTTIPPGLGGVVAVAAGGSHSLALKSDGTVVAWGDNTAQNGGYGGESVVPAGLSSVVRIAAGDFHSVAVRSNGVVVAWGDNAAGQCSVPLNLTNVVAVTAGGAHTVALKADGSVAAWGSDAAGQCDLANNLSEVVAIAAGEAHSVILVRSVAPPSQLWNAVWRGGKFNAVVQTLNRKNYALEYSLSLSPQVWVAVSTNAGNGALVIVSDPSAAGPFKLYRIRQF